MDTQVSHIVKDSSNDQKEGVEKKLIFWETVNIVFKTTGVITWFLIFFLTLLELKRYFNIDIIPGYNSAVDDVYNSVRSTIFK